LCLLCRYSQLDKHISRLAASAISVDWRCRNGRDQRWFGRTALPASKAFNESRPRRLHRPGYLMSLVLTFTSPNSSSLPAKIMFINSGLSHVLLPVSRGVAGFLRPGVQRLSPSTGHGLNGCGRGLPLPQWGYHLPEIFLNIYMHSDARLVRKYDSSKGAIYIVAANSTSQSQNSCHLHIIPAIYCGGHTLHEFLGQNIGGGLTDNISESMQNRDIVTIGH